jgi:hypothetical protein
MLTGHHLIAGAWVAGDTTFLSTPSTGQAHSFAVGTPAHIDAAVQAAEAAFAVFDPDGTGAVSAAAFRDVFAALSDAAAKAGANSIVAGSAVFKPGQDPALPIAQLRRAVEKYGHGAADDALTPLPAA